jgi:hypothetical protein
MVSQSLLELEWSALAVRELIGSDSFHHTVSAIEKPGESLLHLVDTGSNIVMSEQMLVLMRQCCCDDESDRIWN